MTVITIQEMIPPIRADGVPWNRVQIEEGPSDIGPWVIIDTIVFGDPDVDPSNPKPRSFSTDNATLEEGWYVFTWLDAVGQISQPLEPMHNIALPTVSYLPTIREAADYVRARTKDNLGNERGTFTDATRPTAVAVASIINKAASDFTTKFDYDIPTEMYQQARDLIALGAALRIEISYFPEQVGTDRTAYAELKALYDDMFARFEAGLAREQAEEETGDESVSGRAAFSFPVVEPLLHKKM